MPRKKNTVGGGNQTNINGLGFEQETTLADALMEAGFILTPTNLIYFGKENVGKLVQKMHLYKDFLEPLGVDWRDILSKRMLPDDCFVNYKDKTVYVIEKKFQSSAGSVDEKLQTCDFKRRQYERLFASIDYKIKYIYLLCDWFKKPEYRDVLKYIKDVGCDYYFNEIPLSVLGLPDFSAGNYDEEI